MRRLAAAYLFVQGTLAVIWWAGLFASPAFRRLFLVPGAPDVTLMAFLGADVVFFIGGSWLSALLILREDPRRRTVLLVTCGAIGYASLYMLGLSLATGAGWLGTAAMLAAMAGTWAVAWQLR